MLSATLVWWVLISIGILLLGLEIFIGGFIVFWFGVGAIVAGLLTLIFPTMGIGLQLLLTGGIGGTLLYIFRGRLKNKQTAAEPMGLFRPGTGLLHADADGRIQGVVINGTSWGIANPESLREDAADGQAVQVVSFRSNMAVIAHASE